MRRTLILLAALIAAGPIQTGCSSRARMKAETKVADLLISQEQEKDIGRQLKKQLEKEGMRYVQDPEVEAYVEGIGERVFRKIRKRELAEELHVHVIDDPGQVNAFATPGGHLYLFSGLLLEADNEAEVAGVVGHEAGHVIGRHAARKMLYAYGYSALASLALGQNPSLLEQVAAGILGQGFMATHSRSEEEEADRLGVHYVARAGYDPDAMVSFFQKLKEKEGQTPAVLAWFSSHPTTQDRIGEIRSIIKRDKLQGGELGEDRHRDVVQRLEGGDRRRERRTGPASR